MNLLESKSLSDQYSKYAHNCILKFIAQGEVLYGDTFLSFNVHSLCHLAMDVQNHGCLTENSAFPFENFNSQFKFMVRARKNPIVEFTNRYYEKISVSFFQQEKVKKTAKRKAFHSRKSLHYYSD